MSINSPNPEIECTLPGLTELRADTVAWLASHRWLGGECTEEHVDKWRFCEFALLWFPGAPADVTRRASMFNHLISVLDDACEASPEAIEVLAGLVRPESFVPKSEPDPVLRAIADAWIDFVDQMAHAIDGAKPYLYRVFETLLEAYRWEHGWRSRGQPPPPDEFDQWRWLSGGLEVYGLLLAEVAGLTVAQLETEAARAQLQAAGTLACVENDLPSAERDRAIKNPINIVLVAEHYGIRSIDEWREKWHRRLADPEFPRRTSAHAAFTAALANIYPGTQKWMKLTRRYTMPTAASE